MRRGKWLGPLHLTTCQQAFGAPRVDGCCSTVKEIDNDTGAVVGMSYARGYAIRYRGREAIVVGVRSEHPRCPIPPRAWLRLKRYYLLWVLRGRPAMGYDNSTDQTAI